MNVCLGFPRVEGPRSTTATLAEAECLGLGYLASSLRAAGHVVTIINAELENLDVSETIARCVKAEAEVLGCSPVSLSINPALEVLEVVKERLPGVFTVLGGHLATLAPKELLAGEPYVDAVIRGDAEQSFPALLNAGRVTALYKAIPGVLWRDPTGVVRESTHAVDSIDLDTIPFPARDDLIGCIT